MKNLQKLALAVIVAVMAIGFSAFKLSEKEANFDTTYYYEGNPEAWDELNAVAADQTAGKYIEIEPSDTYSCVTSTNVCTYVFNAGKFRQSTQGDNSLQ